MRFSRLSSMWRILARLPSLRTGAGIGRPLVGCRGERQREMERGTVVLAALGPDPAAVELDELLGDREAEAGAVGLLRERVVEPLERLEQPLEIRLRDADAGVGDGDVQRVRLGAHPDEDAAG